MLRRGLRVGEDVVTQLCLMGLLPTCPLPPLAALELLERVVRRAAAAAVHDASALQVTNPALLEAIMKLAQSPVQPPPPAFDVAFFVAPPPPQLLLRRDSFWRATTVIAALACHNFESLGALVWREGQLPTVRALMQALLTRCAAFPLHPTHGAERAAAASAAAVQVRATERANPRGSQFLV